VSRLDDLLTRVADVAAPAELLGGIGRSR
jgi:hypothetical protein